MRSIRGTAVATHVDHRSSWLGSGLHLEAGARCGTPPGIMPVSLRCEAPYPAFRCALWCRYMLDRSRRRAVWGPGFISTLISVEEAEGSLFKWNHILVLPTHVVRFAIARRVLEVHGDGIIASQSRACVVPSVESFLASIRPLGRAW